MRTRSSTIIAAGVVAALLGGLLVFAYGRSVQGSTSGGDVTAWVASKDIPPGTPWDKVKGSIAEQTVPAAARPTDAVSGPDALEGRKTVRAVSKGEVVTASQFGVTERAEGVGLTIPPKHNAVSVNVGTPQGVARYVQPGDLVNVYVSYKGNGQREQRTITKLVLSNVQVLSNRVANASDASTGEVVLTLALTPSDSEKVLFSKENGSLWFGLVSPGDGKASTSGRTFANALN